MTREDQDLLVRLERERYPADVRIPRTTQRERLARPTPPPTKDQWTAHWLATRRDRYGA